MTRALLESVGAKPVHEQHDGGAHGGKAEQIALPTERCKATWHNVREAQRV